MALGASLKVLGGPGCLLGDPGCLLGLLKIQTQTQKRLQIHIDRDTDKDKDTDTENVLWGQLTQTQHHDGDGPVCFDVADDEDSLGESIVSDDWDLLSQASAC